MTTVAAQESAAVLRLRLANQRLHEPTLADPHAAVAHLGAVQSQDYPAALWAVALRLPETRISTLQQAFDAGAILRTHVLRPTWHFVAPEDIRWMLALTGPRIVRGMASRQRQLGIDQALATRTADVLARALEGGQALTRADIGQVIAAAGVPITDPSLLSHLIWRCELSGLICSGPRRDRHNTWMLLEDRATGPTRDLAGEAAVAELVNRYFTSHGPATVHDFAWWSGLTTADAKRGLAAHGSRFTSMTLGDARTYWFAESLADAAPSDVPAAWLLPNYDEYTVAYRFRELFYPYEFVFRPGPRLDAPFANVIVIDGMVEGLWRRRVRRDAASVEPTWFNSPSPAQLRAFEIAAERYAAFFADADADALLA